MRRRATALNSALHMGHVFVMSAQRRMQPKWYVWRQPDRNPRSTSSAIASWQIGQSEVGVRDAVLASADGRRCPPRKVVTAGKRPAASVASRVPSSNGTAAAAARRNRRRGRRAGGDGDTERGLTGEGGADASTRKDEGGSSLGVAPRWDMTVSNLRSWDTTGNNTCRQLMPYQPRPRTQIPGWRVDATADEWVTEIWSCGSVCRDNLCGTTFGFPDIKFDVCQTLL